jgi:hypothetical protein
VRPGARWCWPPLLVVALALLAAPAALAGELDRFFGSYVGRAEEGGGGRPGELRDVDLVIAPEGRGGLVVRWTNVTLVDGRRDVPGVRRRTDEVRLMPAGEGRPALYLARAPYDPFTERERPDPLAAGHPVRWATVEGDALRTYSLVVLDDGRYELQVYARTLTPEGIALDWRRIVDGETVRRMTGRTVRAD